MCCKSGHNPDRWKESNNLPPWQIKHSGRYREQIEREREGETHEQKKFGEIGPEKSYLCGFGKVSSYVQKKGYMNRISQKSRDTPGTELFVCFAVCQWLPLRTPDKHGFTKDHSVMLLLRTLTLLCFKPNLHL